jgi:hypothetical protein
VIFLSNAAALRFMQARKKYAFKKRCAGMCGQAAAAAISTCRIINFNLTLFIFDFLGLLFKSN